MSEKEGNGYVPPHLRHDINHKPKNLTYKPKMIWAPNLKSKEELYEEYRNENNGKADEAWK